MTSARSMERKTGRVIVELATYTHSLTRNSEQPIICNHPIRRLYILHFSHLHFVSLVQYESTPRLYYIYSMHDQKLSSLLYIYINCATDLPVRVAVLLTLRRRER
jgi:hypothetical protein